MLNVNKKMAIGFIVFKPESSFFDRLVEIDQAQITTFIFDNSPGLTATRDFVSQLSCRHYFSSGINVGLGVGLYELCHRAHQENFESLLFFDQDTKFNLETIAFIRNFYSEMGLELVSKHSAICFSGAQEQTRDHVGHQSHVDVDLVINSGSLFFLKNVEKMGWHNQSYFVDGVDYEFCLRSHIAGLRVGKFLNTPYFDHESEQPDKVVTILGKRLLIRKYSLARVRDGFHSYLRLIYSAVRSGQFKYVFLFCRSFLIYIFGQLLARISR